jgi:hypothetical protein
MKIDDFFNQPHVKPPTPKIPRYHVKWFRSFGLAYWCDRYTEPWSDMIDYSHNLVLFFVRIQVKVQKTTVITADGSLKVVTES